MVLPSFAVMLTWPSEQRRFIVGSHFGKSQSFRAKRKEFTSMTVSGQGVVNREVEGQGPRGAEKTSL